MCVAMISSVVLLTISCTMAKYGVYATWVVELAIELYLFFLENGLRLKLVKE